LPEDKQGEKKNVEPSSEEELKGDDQKKVDFGGLDFVFSWLGHP
jgi:hypothetical protein